MSLGFEWDFSNVVAILSVVIPLLAFVWEFGVAGRKRLGYRVQMDTPATGAGHAPSANVLAGMRVDTRSLNEPSFVLMRIENAGWVEIGESDYLAPTTNATGIWVTFPQRRVVGMAVTELSDPALRSFFITETRADDGSTETREASGFGHGEQDGAGLIKLPKVMLNKGAHYKVLAVLERKPGTSGDVPRPVFRAGVLGDGHNRWFRWLGWFARLKMARTEAHLFASRPALLGIALLTAAVLTQASLTLFWREDPRRWTASTAPCTCTAPRPSRAPWRPPPRTTSTGAKVRTCGFPLRTIPSRAAPKGSPNSTRPAGRPRSRSVRDSVTTSPSPTASPPTATPVDPQARRLLRVQHRHQQRRGGPGSTVVGEF
ncbi:hypothetical protein ACFQ0G_46270 [Streptomyces chiangmaiensis]